MTMMLNALGKAHGGSGTPINPKKHEASLMYWNDHANVTYDSTSRGFVKNSFSRIVRCRVKKYTQIAWPLVAKAWFVHSLPDASIDVISPERVGASNQPRNGGLGMVQVSDLHQRC